MESLGLSPLNSLSTLKCKFQKQQCRKLAGGKRDYLSCSKLSSSSTLNLSSYRTHSQYSSIRVSAVQGDDPARQMKELADARKRWDALIREEKVKVLTPREAGYAIKLSYKNLLDVRPSNERQKAWVKGSIWIPAFDVDNNLNAGVISKKITNFMMGGWWSGIPTFSYNKEFIPKVVEKFPQDSDLIVACQKGLRSLAACEQLYNAGYRNLFWVQGGLEAAEEEDLEREGPQPFKFAGIGGVSEFLGWTDQQRAAAAKEDWGYRLVFSARLIGLIVLADALFIGAQQLNHYLQDLRH